MNRLVVCLAVLAVCSSALAQRVDNDEQRVLPRFNALVLDIIADYEDGGDGGYVWPTREGRHGTTRDLYLGKTRVARQGRGTHCVGITFEVLWRALERWPGGPAGLGLDADESQRLRYLWFVPSGHREGPAEALPAFGLGIAIDKLEDALPGDFVQMWMNSGRGHLVVFLGWLRDANGHITGLRYWSSQPWTRGIGVSSHLFGDRPNQVDRRAVFIGRARPSTTSGSVR